MSPNTILQKQFEIPEGSLVLVTGANGYLGSNIVDLFLDLGYNVRGVVRSEKPWLNELFDGRHGKGRFETVVIPVLDKAGAFDNALDGVSGIIHVAADVSLSPDPNAVIPIAIVGVENLLSSAAKHPSVKRVVFTSSSTAALIPKPNVEKIVTEDTWNEEAVRAAWSDDTPADQMPYFVYAAAKTESERAAWKWVDNNKPGFVLNAVLPDINYGRLLAPQHITGSTIGLTRKLLLGDPLVMSLFPPQYYVDVQDTARLHAVALLDPAVKHERIFGFAGEHNWTDVVNIFRKIRPNREVPSAPENEGRDLSEVKPAKRAEQLLQSFFGKGWTSLEESLSDGIADIE